MGLIDRSQKPSQAVSRFKQPSDVPLLPLRATATFDPQNRHAEPAHRATTIIAIRAL